MIFFQGADDKVVPPSQTELMVAALANQGIPVGYFLFGGEQHGIESLGDIFADLREIVATTTRALGRRRVNNAPAWKMIGKIPPRPLSPRKALYLDDARRRVLRVILPVRRDQLLELQLHLLDESLAALGAWPEHLPLHLGDHQLQVLNQRLRAHELGARLDQRRLQCGAVIGKMIGGLDHACDISTIALIRAINFAP